MKHVPIQLDGPYYGRKARRHATVRWLVVAALAVAAAAACTYGGAYA